MTNVSLSKDTLSIGEEVELVFQITLNNGAKLDHVDIKQFDSIPSLVKTSSIPDSMLRETYAEIEWPIDIDGPNRKLNTSQFVKIGNVLEKKMAIRFWDIGIFQLPSLNIVLDSSFAKTRVTPLESAIVYVMPPEGIQPQDTTQMLMPIAPILVESKTWEDFVWLAYLLAFILTVLLVIYMVRRAKKKDDLIEEEEVIIIRPAHEVGLEKLISLKDKGLWQQGKIKEYQSELTYIIREYLENRFGIHALESTTEEIAKDLKEQDFDTDQEKTLREILQIADLVKFAKAKPSDDIHSKFMDQAVDFVEQTKKLIQILEDKDELVQ